MSNQETNSASQLLGKKLLVSISPLSEVRDRDYESHSDGGTTGRSDLNDNKIYGTQE
jgi:hypothetical protein